ncbi:multidrug and toxin extrusion protein 1 [Pyricularia oryzae 70-15]|uniref:Multidrug and toxin extrusion protein 1 n=3 Tax=Pyricularia oryzae TaxID=318829 RepID=G4NF92_PYRO7|nr:multidrug and toxin extrusion protein 1 [Pyricularia oryzae 70-15]EHA47274.1 multidrug and toxin extrusion protein 1 [Pyricularia oryzae 70-15]ELQ36855.1 multidrug and toxin extrusion protein 1 [Pyricularia oryzae Y34]KAI7929215.1 multidrug and toxin extrusion protein 1 [Pyricularia oryzae]KAI7930052.1 multidrug and toxin extrusion protein 1 [Pyricularia oryzae]
MSASRPIPGGSSKNPGSSSHDFPASFVASFRSSSPIAQEVIARDLAACSDDEDFDPEADGPGLGASDSVVDGDNPLMYRRPSGIAFGTARPVLAAQNVEDSILTREEWKQSLDAERSLLRDNHILPPKHAHPEQLGLLGRLRKRFFSTKVPRPSGSDEEAGPDLDGIPTEESPLLAGDGNDAPRRHSSSAAAAETGHLSETWEAAVAAGHIKTTWQREAKTLAVYSRSLVVTFLLQYSVNITSILAVGRIGKVELGAVSLATMSANILCYAPIQGLATSLDTLCAQAYGSGHKHLVGLQLQRMTAFLLLLLFPIGVLWLHAAELLVKFGIARPSAELAGLYLRICIFSMPAYAIFEASKRFVQAQGLFHATTYCLMISAPLNVLINWLLVWKLGWGFVGAPVSVVITQNLQPILLFLYVRFVDGYQCWGGFSKRAFSNWGPMIRLAIPGMIMVEAEWLAFEILTLTSGRFGTSQLAAQSVIVTLAATTYQIPFPLSVAVSTRVANLIGAKLADAAKTSAKVAIVAGIIIGLFNTTVLSVFRWKLPLLFTKDPEVIEIVARTMPILVVLQFFDAVCAISQGLLRGLGQQEFAGYSNIISYYAIALPISFATALGLGWELKGLWFGVTIGLAVVMVVEYSYLRWYDWNRAVRDAENRNASN